MRYFVLISLLLTIVAADVTIIPTDVTEPKAYQGQGAATSGHDLISGSASSILKGHDFSIQLSSMRQLSANDGIRSSSDSFVRGAIEAWAGHQHLVIRPEHVWFSILVQMNFYMTKHADDESVRSTFVSFSGKQDIRIKGNDLGDIIPRFQYEIQKRVKTDWLLDWIQPNFTTSTPDDNMTANILMMGLMKGYFNYIASIVCGIPSFTLVGEKSDWVRLHQKLDRIPIFGKEPANYAANLRPVLSRFVRSFETPNDPTIRQFWQDIVKVLPGGGICGASPYHVSGWINAFHYWDTQGNQLHGNTENVPTAKLDGITYPMRDIKYFPTAFATAPIKVEDNGREYNVTALAGLLGKKITQEVPKGYANAMRKANGDADVSIYVNSKDHTTLEPVSSWFVYQQKESMTSVSQGEYDKMERWPRMSCLKR
jgi:hypothetical protein